MDSLVRLNRQGGAEALEIVPLFLDEIKPGEVSVQQYAIGVNFADICYRKGSYCIDIPANIGLEGAGEVIGCGFGVRDFKVGDRVAYCGGSLGSYADVRDIHADWLVPLPQKITYEEAVSSLIYGVAAYCLTKKVYSVKPWDTVLIHAVAGGAGLQLLQWAKMLGARVIGTCGSPEKEKVARSYGCDHVVLYKERDCVECVMEIT